MQVNRPSSPAFSTRPASVSAVPIVFGKTDPSKKAEQPRYYEPKPWKTFKDAMVTTIRWGFVKPVLNFDVRMTEQDRRKLKELAASDHSIVITPNHARKMLDILTMMELGRQTGMSAASMSAIERFEAIPPFSKYFWQWLGCFSVDRSAASKDESLKEARRVVEQGDMPLLLFPNGAPLGNTRDVGPMKHGAAKTAIDALQGGNLQKKGVMIVPLSLFYEHKGDISSFLKKKVAELEALLKRDNIPLEPPLPEDSPLPARVNRLFNAMVYQREQKYVKPDEVNPELPDAYERLQWMLHCLMDRLERKYDITTDLHQPFSWRTSSINSELRVRIKAVRAEKNESLVKEIQRDMKALRDIRKLSLYQKDYVNGDDQDRMFDMLAKLHESITGKEMDPIIYSRNQQVLVNVHDPIDVREFLAQLPTGNDNAADRQLTEHIRQTLQAGLDAQEAVQKARRAKP